MMDVADITAFVIWMSLNPVCSSVPPTGYEKTRPLAGGWPHSNSSTECKSYEVKCPKCIAYA